MLKKCPNCKIWTEKNEGYNHMTCAECKYQCCWLCLGEYNLNHYSKGKCNGLQFYIPKSEKEIKETLEDPNSNNRRIDNYYNVINGYRQPSGLIPFPYHGNFNPNNPLELVYENYTHCKLIGYILFYLFLTFQCFQLGIIYRNFFQNQIIENEIVRNIMTLIVLIIFFIDFFLYFIIRFL